MNQRGIKHLKLPWTNVFAWKNSPPSVKVKGHEKEGRLVDFLRKITYYIQ